MNDLRQRIEAVKAELDRAQIAASNRAHNDDLAGFDAYESGKASAYHKAIKAIAAALAAEDAPVPVDTMCVCGHHASQHSSINGHCLAFTAQGFCRCLIDRELVEAAQ